MKEKDLKETVGKDVEKEKEVSKEAVTDVEDHTLLRTAPKEEEKEDQITSTAKRVKQRRATETWDRQLTLGELEAIDRVSHQGKAEDKPVIGRTAKCMRTSVSTQKRIKKMSVKCVEKLIQ